VLIFRYMSVSWKTQCNSFLWLRERLCGELSTILNTPSYLKIINVPEAPVIFHRHGKQSFSTQ